MSETHSTPIPLSKVAKGDFIRRKADSKTTYRKGEYCRETKRYSLIDCDDCNREIFVKGATIVFVGFTY